MAHGDARAAVKGLRELAVPFFHHEFVRQAVTQALQGAASEARVLPLLGRLSECGLVSSNQLAKVRGGGNTSGSTGTLEVLVKVSRLQRMSVFVHTMPPA